MGTQEFGGFSLNNSSRVAYQRGFTFASTIFLGRNVFRADAAGRGARPLARAPQGTASPSSAATATSTVTGCQILGKRLDVSADARLLKRGHVIITRIDGDDSPGIAAGGHHDIHQEAAHAAIAVEIRMDIDEHEVSEHDPDGGVFLSS